MTLSFGLRVPTAGLPQETAEYAARVEGAGFDFLWMPDTPLLAGRWRDVYGHLMCAALTTKTLRLGPGVTNPLTRHPVTTASAILTLDEASNGRADLVAGTGYSSAYIIGHKAATLATMRQRDAPVAQHFPGAGHATGRSGNHPADAASAPADLSRRHRSENAGDGWRNCRRRAHQRRGSPWSCGLGPRTHRCRRTTGRTTAAHGAPHPGGAGHGGRDKARAIDHMRPCVAGNYRHGHARELLRLAGLPEPPALTGAFPRLYPDLGHAGGLGRSQAGLDLCVRRCSGSHALRRFGR